MLALQSCVKENWIPLPSATQLVEFKVKDTTFCKSTGKSEWITSNLAMIRSLSIPMVLSAIKESEEFKNRMRRNDNAKDYFYAMKCNEQTLAANFDRRQELATISEAEIKCSKIILSKERHYSHKCQHDTVTKWIKSKDKSKRPNAAMRVSGVEHTPLLMV